MANPKQPTIDEVPHGIELLATHLCDIRMVLEKIEEQMMEHNGILRSTEPSSNSNAMIAVPQSRDVLDRLERLEASIPARLDEIVAGVSQIPGLIGKLESRLNKLESAPSAGEAAAAVAQVVKQSEAAAPTKRRGRPANPEKCPHPEFEALPNDLRRCTRCGIVLEAPPVEQQVREKAAELGVPAEALRTPAEVAQVKQAVEAVKTPPATPAKEPVFKAIDGKMVEVDPDTLEPIVTVPVEEQRAQAAVEKAATEPEITIDDVRAVAIGYANKHGKDKLGEVLRKYGQGNLSSVAPESYKALLAELSNGV